MEAAAMPQTESVADNAGPNVRSVERIAAILTAFTAARPMLTLSEVARTAALDKNTTRRLLIALSRTGLVRRDEAEGTYGLDIAMLKLQPAVVGPRALRETAAPYLQRLTTETGMTSFFWLPDPSGAICIERVRASGVFLDVPWSSPGSTLPLNMAAGPRVILAYLDEPARRAWLAQPQPARTQSSQTDPAELEEAAGRIRERGHEMVADDFVVGLAGLGAPVFDRLGAFVASVSVTTRSGDFDDPALLARTLAAVRETAADIGVRLEGGPSASD
ncbi:MAG: IclR family transcriptional regulator [Hyphomicrobiales bacterium]|nr:MAG: IclR family transcriptional regulator [Hyphomicrobiales bacterium]